MSAEPISAFLACADLDDLADAFEALPAVPDESGRAAEVVAAWSDVQAVANVLMYVAVLPPEGRPAAVIRGLREEGYLRIAAAVGAGELSVADLADHVRRDVLDALLDLVASDAGPAGVRASAELGRFLRAEEVELLDDLAAHPHEAVRHNVAQAATAATAPGEQLPVLLPWLPSYADVVEGVADA